MLCIHMTKKLLRWSVGTFLQAGLKPTKKAVHSTPGNQATCMLYLHLVSVPYYLDQRIPSK